MMAIHTENRGQVLVIRTGGNINKTSADELHELLHGAIAEGVTRLVFDFSTVSHISSDGLRVILKAIEKIHSRKGQVALAEMGEQVRGIFEASGLLALIREFTDLEAAVDAASPGSS
ncbi:MAG: STAS domain-containing protein [Betaproteobacteria bacterium]|nr:STAS domain-containing protein [Betaproteobacteria bacterium]